MQREPTSAECNSALATREAGAGCCLRHHVTVVADSCALSQFPACFTVQPASCVSRSQGSSCPLIEDPLIVGPCIVIILSSSSHPRCTSLRRSPRRHDYNDNYVISSSRSIRFAANLLRRWILLPFDDVEEKRGDVKFNLLRWNDVPRASTTFCSKIVIISQFQVYLSKTE